MSLCKSVPSHPDKNPSSGSGRPGPNHSSSLYWLHVEASYLISLNLTVLVAIMPSSQGYFEGCFPLDICMTHDHTSLGLHSVVLLSEAFDLHIYSCKHLPACSQHFFYSSHAMFCSSVLGTIQHTIPFTIFVFCIFYLQH